MIPFDILHPICKSMPVNVVYKNLQSYRKTMQYSFQIASKYVIALGLMLINLVHVIVASYFKIPGNLLDKDFPESIFVINVLYYAIAIISTVLYPFIARNMSLKSILIIGLIFDMLGLAIVWLSNLLGGVLLFIYVSNILWGISLLTVTISIITFLVIEYPRKLGVAMTTLFAFGDLGDMLTNFLFAAFSGTQFNQGFFLLTMSLTACLLYFVTFKFIDPEFPKHLEPLRKGSLIWKELHYRLVFFLIAAIGYGVIESVFAIWGEVYLLEYIPRGLAVSTVSMFWFSMMIGQVVLLLPLYFFPVRKIFPVLIVSLLLSIIFVQHQTNFFGLMTGFGLVGFSCAAILPIIMASMEMEMISASPLSQNLNYLPYVEIGTALLIGGYYVGIAAVDLSVLAAEQAAQIKPHNFFHWVILITAFIGLITMFLNWSSSNEQQT